MSNKTKYTERFEVKLREGIKAEIDKFDINISHSVRVFMDTLIERLKTVMPENERTYNNVINEVADEVTDKLLKDDFGVSISETITVSLLAMSLSTPEKPMGEKRLFKAMREKGIMDENKPLIPKKEYIEKGYFKLGNSGTKTLITAAGIDFIKQSLGYSDEK